jgi:formate hydrogenlyase subunit 4
VGALTMGELDGAAATIALAVIQLVVLVAFAPLLAGTVRRTKARLQGRRGVPLLQPWLDLIKWWSKSPLNGGPAGIASRLAPPVALGAMLLAILLVPFLAWRAPLQGWGDLLVVVGLLALARFAIALAALDAGGAFGGMGSSRDVAIAALAEPGLVLALVVAALAASSTDLGAMSWFGLRAGVGLLTPAHLLGAAAFALVAVAETGHYPVDNPDTHLELTMIHEGMLLEASGRSLALLMLGSQLKLVLLASMFAAVFFPFGAAVELTPAALAIGLGAGLVKLLLAGQALALLDATLTKVRILSLPDLIGTASLLALAGLGVRLLLTP